MLSNDPSCHISTGSTDPSRPSAATSCNTEPYIQKAHDYSAISPEKLKRPWQYYGYPALAQWMASANDFLVLRRFSPLQARCLLYLQHQIAIKDRQLRELDEKVRQLPAGQGVSAYINSDPSALGDHPRPRIIQETIPLLQQYNDLVQSFSNMKAKSTASPNHIQNLDNWFATYGENAISKDEQHYKHSDGDLFTMLSKHQYPIVTLLHRSKLIRRCFKSKRRDDRSKDRSTTYTSSRALEAFATLIALFVGLSMTFASIWWLNAVTNTVYRLAIITASGTIMTLIAWLAAGNRPFEILATFAAYMAVLMIYRQIT